MSNLMQRVLTAVIAIPLIVYLAMTGGLPFFVLVAALSGIGIVEFYRLAGAKGDRPFVAGGVILGCAINLAFFHMRLRAAIWQMFDAAGIPMPFPSAEQLLVIVLVVGVVLLTLVELFRNNGSALHNLGATLLGCIYVSASFGTLIGMRELFSLADLSVAHHFLIGQNIRSEEEISAAGGYMVIALLCMIWACDTGAYYVGRAFGKHKLFPRVSPNKSWEGAVAGFLSSVIVAAAAKYYVLGFLTMSQALTLGLLVGLFGQLGDLVESLFKRDAGVKDSSALIPGHGGVLDRFDSLLLASPVVYLYLDYIVF